jgi:hypothetical protein
MKEQNFKNHIRFYPPHHFVLLPLLAFAIFLSAYHIFQLPNQHVFFVWITLALIFIFAVAVMMRQHYALNNQDRIVRLEMRLRYYELTGQRFLQKEQQLSFKQLAALRFASDEELLLLIDKAIAEKLSPKEIKQSIRNWQPDYMRV